MTPVLYNPPRINAEWRTPSQRARDEQAFYDRYGNESPFKSWPVRIGAALIAAEFGLALVQHLPFGH